MEDQRGRSQSRESSVPQQASNHQQSSLSLCIGIRDTSRDDNKNHPNLLPNKTPISSNNQSRRLSTLLGIKKVCPSNVELYVKSSCHKSSGDVDGISMITSVTFFCEPGKTFVHAEDVNHKDTYDQYYPPFSLKKLVLEPCEFSIRIKFQDRSIHFVKLTFDLIHFKEVPFSCFLNLSKIPREVPPSPLPSQKFYVEFDLLVPYPYSLTPSSSPQHIAHFIEQVAIRPCRYVGFYHNAPLDGLSQSEKLLYDLSWKLAMVNVPLSADRVQLPLVLKLKSPAVKGIHGLESVASVMKAIESAFDELKVLRRPGIRVGIDLGRYDFDQIRKLTLQYFKFYDVIEEIVSTYEEVDVQYIYSEDPRDRVYLNTHDMLVQRIEESHEFSLVGNYLGVNHGVVSIINEASCVEELLEFVCPYANRSYRYDMRPLLFNKHLEFRFEMPDIEISPVSCIIGLLLRFVSRAVHLPTPKKFSKKGVGKTLAMRKRKFFEWLIKDRNLEQYFNVQVDHSNVDPQVGEMAVTNIDMMQFHDKGDVLNEIIEEGDEDSHGSADDCQSPSHSNAVSLASLTSDVTSHMDMDSVCSMDNSQGLTSRSNSLINSLFSSLKEASEARQQGTTSVSVGGPPAPPTSKNMSSFGSIRTKQLKGVVKKKKSTLPV